jgi:hypothetical protein
MKKQSVWNLLKQVHDDERGGVLSIEVILIVGAIALPILILLLVKAWPLIKNYFKQGVSDIIDDASSASSSW